MCSCVYICLDRSVFLCQYVSDCLVEYLSEPRIFALYMFIGLSIGYGKKCRGRGILNVALNLIQRQSKSPERQYSRHSLDKTYSLTIGMHIHSAVGNGNYSGFATF